MSTPRTYALALWACLLTRAACAENAPPGCELRIHTEPPGAAVTLDGAPQGATPLTLSAVAPGEHLLAIRKLGHLDLRKTLSLEPEQRLALDLQLKPIVGLVLVASQPAGAEVLINDAARGVSPLLLTDLPLGRYRVLMRAAGHLPKAVDLEVRDRVPVKIEVALESDSATLVVESDPPGANVLVNGLAVGVSPCTADRLPLGGCTLRVFLEGYQPYEQTLKLRAGQTETLAVALEPMPAALRVVSIPEKARVYVDDQYQGETPLDVTVEPGEHRIRAELAGYEPLARDVTLEQAQNTVEEFRLEANSGALEIVTDPPGVTIEVDGEPVGDTLPAPDARTESLPLEVALLASGTHRIRLSKEGYVPRDLNITVQKDETLQLRQRLERHFVPDCEVRTPSGVERGILVDVAPGGDVRLEVRPGVFKTIPAADVTSRRALPE